jgi:hypothetical protein
MSSKNLSPQRGEAIINYSLLAAARSRGAKGGPRCCGRGFFAYFLFPKKVREMAVSLLWTSQNSLDT